ncbi:Carbohydrate kinase family protein [Desulfonema limicola]|uniref:Carbohydrate kinase family protein n=1 Tax=Desulfonema limicola TaxID=45656 RepID=A0A975BAZ5_9BACT|nr:NAD(P)H-hydrate dehydratase [Desulfonema limicola]QTA82294.1 Carbohydrate kinase family protein [Desulfonema limicola]
MLGIVGTVPDKDFPLICGPVSVSDDKLCIGPYLVPVNRGTPALIAAAFKTSEILGTKPPFAFLAGDTGLGRGSRELYAHLEKKICDIKLHTLVFHYLQPDADWHNRVLFQIQAMSRKPLLIADAGFMYAAKMSGQAGAYDLFTPDLGELAFLADEDAPHPFYTRGFILHEENQAPELINRAYLHDNAAKYMLVKGHKDYVVKAGTILEIIDSPQTEALEAIGGTGDTLTGIVSALIASGRDIAASAKTAARINRLAGALACPTPASCVTEIISKIPQAFSSLKISR